MKSRIGSWLLAVLSGTASAKSLPPTIAFVTIKSHGYSIEKTHYETISQLLAGLKAMPKLDGIGLTRLPGAAEEALPLTIKAIQAAGISVRIAIVGNEVFAR